MMICLIAYDITSPRRLQKIFRLLSEYAQPIQKSVFLFDDSPGEFEACWQQLSQIIDKKQDDIRAYTLAHKGACYDLLGTGQLPDGIVWSGTHVQAVELLTGTR
ncbi:CRISPR-associated endonuclease Cas2 [Pelistega sp. MC2]|uniref:CRISPR-associated endonuclease Cas2 n=1 Tax=Pelistega sp. MC2 TaxID=1720297 RepID=UPI0008DAB6AD|nr:CRISPR-associated endonuclease Cas2 [Pelistega sp. MC2]